MTSKNKYFTAARDHLAAARDHLAGAGDYLAAAIWKKRKKSHSDQVTEWWGSWRPTYWVMRLVAATRVFSMYVYDKYLIIYFLDVLKYLLNIMKGSKTADCNLRYTVPTAPSNIVSRAQFKLNKLGKKFILQIQSLTKPATFSQLSKIIAAHICWRK